MEEKEFIEMVINERIGHLLQEEKAEKEDPVSDRAEAILNGLEEEKRIPLEGYMNRLVEVTAQHEKYLYLEGFRDGVRLMLRIGRIERGEESGREERET